MKNEINKFYIRSLKNDLMEFYFISVFFFILICKHFSPKILIARQVHIIGFIKSENKITTIISTQN